MQEVFKTKTRDEWCEILEGTDVCFAPVLSLDEAPEHPHNKERETFVDVNGAIQPAPAPRFSRTPGKIHRPPPSPGEHTDEVLGEWGFASDELGRLREAGAIG
jgi:alpha-methylacyl-CoA racemase